MCWYLCPLFFSNVNAVMIHRVCPTYPACVSALLSYILQHMHVVVPSSGFTQRATLDPDLNEIHVLTVSYVCRVQVK